MIRERYLKYKMLRAAGYSPTAALWNVRHCSYIFWQSMQFYPHTNKPVRHNI